MIFIIIHIMQRDYLEIPLIHSWLCRHWGTEGLFPFLCLYKTFSVGKSNQVIPFVPDYLSKPSKDPSKPLPFFDKVSRIADPSRLLLATIKQIVFQLSLSKNRSLLVSNFPIILDPASSTWPASLDHQGMVCVPQCHEESLWYNRENGSGMATSGLWMDQWWARFRGWLSWQAID